MKLRIADYRRIAATMNKTLPGNANVTAGQVRDIATNKDRTESHPVWQLIHREIRIARRRRK